MYASYICEHIPCLYYLNYLKIHIKAIESNHLKTEFDSVTSIIIVREEKSLLHNFS